MEEEFLGWFVIFVLTHETIALIILTKGYHMTYVATIFYKILISREIYYDNCC